MEKVAIAVIMTVHNRRDTTKECLQKVFEQKGVDEITLDVYMTDDGCTDGTAEMVKKDFPSVNVVKGDGTLFWNRGMYVAWEEAAKNGYDFYVWLNNDTALYDNALYELYDSSFMTGHKSIIVGEVKEIGQYRTSYGGYIGGKRIDPDGTLQEVDYFNGNIVWIPNSVYSRLGNLDYRFRHCHGDSDSNISLI